MLFSFKEFQQTKQQLINEFHQQPLLNLSTNTGIGNEQCMEDAEKDEFALMHEYNKILNHVKFLRNSKTNVKRFKCTKQKRGLRNSTTQRTLPQQMNYKSQTKDLLSNFNKNIKKIHNKKSQNGNQNASCQVDELYLTSVSIGKFNDGSENNVKLSEQPNFEEKQVISQRQAECQLQRLRELQISDTQCSKQLNQLIDLHVKIFELSKQQKYLHAEIQELQISVRYYQRLNNGYELRIHQQNKKQTIAINSVLKKQSNLNVYEAKNRYFKDKFESTQSFFSKSLRSIRINLSNQNKRCTQLIDDATQQILTLKFYKEKINMQKLQISKLQEKNKYKCRRIDESKNMDIYADILIKIKQLTDFIKHSPYGKKQQAQLLMKKILKNQEEQFCQRQQYIKIGNLTANRKLCTKLQKQKLHADQINSINFYNLIKQILKIYFRLTNDEERLKNSYQFKINELESNRKFLQIQSKPGNQIYANQIANSLYKDYLNQKQLKVNKFLQMDHYANLLNRVMSKNHHKNGQILFSQEQLDAQRTGRFSGFSISTNETQIKKLELKFKHINQTLLLIEERSRFFVKKLLKCLQSIIQKWLKFDQSAVNFISEAIIKFLCIQTAIKQQLSYSYSKSLLISHFQNWQNYMFFVQQIHCNPIICSFLSKQQLKLNLKKIIKTKLKSEENKQKTMQAVQTVQIFKKCVKNMHKQFINKNMSNIQFLIKLGIQIIQYLSKFQVFLVNSYQTQNTSLRSRAQQKDRNKHDSKINNTTQSEQLQNKISKALQLQMNKHENVINTNQKTKKLVYQHSYEPTKNSQKTQDENQNLQDQNQSNQSIDNESETSNPSSEKQLPDLEKDDHAVANLIMAYRYQMNKISQIKKKC